MKTYITFFIACFAFTALAVSANPTDSLKVKTTEVFTVVLDAGHGGRDPGKYYAQTAEKDIALKVTKLVGDMLSEHGDIKIVYTRDTDKFLGLDERAKIANSAKADFFVSIHCNAADASSAKGNETFVLGLHRNADNLEVVKRENAVILLEENYEEKYEGFDPKDPSSFASMQLAQEEYLDNSIQMAAQIQKNFDINLSRKNRGVKQAGFAVLRLTYMPSVLIETGFITNTEERNFLKSAAGQKKVAQSIYKAILDYNHSRDLNTFQVVPIAQDEVAAVVDENITYKVQISASRNKLPAKSYNFKQMPDISREQEGDIYRYFTGSSNNLKEINTLLKKAKSTGYSSAFIVVFKNGDRRRL
jgi:N-acetylmuramoyl-L-alanine amidase